MEGDQKHHTQLPGTTTADSKRGGEWAWSIGVYMYYMHDTYIDLWVGRRIVAHGYASVLTHVAPFFIHDSRFDTHDSRFDTHDSRFVKWSINPIASGLGTV